MQFDWNRAQTAARLLSTVVVNRHDVLFYLAKEAELKYANSYVIALRHRTWAQAGADLK